MKSKILFKKPVFDIMSFIFNNSTGEFYEKRIAETTNISVGACNKYMKKLSKIEFLHVEKRGKMNFYKLNRENILVKQLKIIFTLDSPLVNEIKEKMKGERTEIFLYGSFARGEDVEDSDFDVLSIATREEQDEITTNLRKIGDKYKKKISIAYFTRNDWMKMKVEDPAFYERVEKDKIRLV
jgi:predicted nucleotidyltransferase